MRFQLDIAQMIIWKVQNMSSVADSRKRGGRTFHFSRQSENVMTCVQAESPLFDSLKMLFSTSTLQVNECVRQWFEPHMTEKAL